MKILIRACLFSAMLTLPAVAYAQTATAPKAETLPTGANGMMMNCPMMAQSSDMQKTMAGMMTDMDAMMKGTADPAMKAGMQKMHEQMSAMMVNMQKMSGMMQGGQQPGSAAPATPNAAPASPEDHSAHHPGQ